MDSTQRFSQALSRVVDGNLQALIAEVVQIKAEHGDKATVPSRRYREKIEAYADTFQDSLVLDHLPMDGTKTPDLGSFARARSTNGITLRSLRLTNFGSYYETNEIDLAPDGQRNVVVVVGSNGDGKSTIFDAIHWALYGEDYIKELRSVKQKSLVDLVNRAAIAEGASSGSPVQTIVMLSFSVKGREYYVTRRIVTNVDSAGTTRAQELQAEVRRIDADGNHQDLLIGALDGLLSSLPRHVKDFYLFDGERINRFVEPGSQHLIRSAIRRVIGVDALEGASKDLASISNAYLREARALSKGELGDVREELLQKKGLLTQEREFLERAEVDRISLSSQIDAIDQKLSATPDVRPLQERRTRLEQAVQQSKRREEELIADQRETAGDASLLLAASSAANLTRVLSEKQEAGTIPGLIGHKLLLDLLHREVCLCGASLGPDTPGRHTVAAHLEEIAARAESSDALVDLSYLLGGLDRLLADRHRVLAAGRLELYELRERRRQDEEEIRDLSTQIGGADDSQRSNWERERKGKSESIRKLDQEIGRLKASIERLTSEINSLESKEARLAQAHDEAKTVSLRAKWSEAAEGALRRIFDDFAAAARRDAEVMTAQLWCTMLPNVSPYKVVVSDDFELSVLDELGQPAMQDLAMGQQQCLGLAFITAVAQMSSERPPLVIDMPFGRLGGDTAASVAATLPTLTEQLVLLVLPDTEWNPNTSEALEPFMRRQYRLRYDAHTLRTTIELVRG